MNIIYATSLGAESATVFRPPRSWTPERSTSHRPWSAPFPSAGTGYCIFLRMIHSSPTRESRACFGPDLLTGRIALVTGGGTGIGRAVATALADCGATIVLAARRADVLETAAQELRMSGATVHTRPFDIRDRAAVEEAADRVTKEIGCVDILVNNAGGQFPHRARDLSPNGWKSVIELNLTGTWNMTQVFGDRMLDGRGGAICQIVVVGGRGIPGLVHSAAARAGVVELTRTVAYEWGPRVRCNCVAPGPIQTDGFADAYDPEHVRRVSGLPLARHGTAEEVADAVTFLVSPAAAYISGEVLNVAGGQHLQGPVQVLPRASFPERTAP